MKSLLIIAHGSPRPEANEDIRRVAGLLRDRHAFPQVLVGFLDCNEPDIAAAIDQCVEAGATEVIAVPYFLHTGKHLLRDIPEILEAAALRYPAVTITIGPYLGAQPEIAAVMRDRVNAVRSQNP